MSYRMHWAVPNRVIISTFRGVVTKGSLIAYMHDMIHKVKEGERPLYHISDSLQLTKVTMSLPALLNLTKLFSVANALTWSVDVNLNPTNKMLASLATQFVRVRIKTVPSMEEAVDFLKSIDLYLANTTWELTPPSFDEDVPKTPTVSALGEGMK